MMFRLTRGVIGGRIGRTENVLLTTTGRKSGKPRTTPLTVTIAEDDALVLVASNGGAPKHPDWYLNLVADPKVTVQRGGSSTRMRARTATDHERAALWPKVVGTYRGYEGYQRKTERTIPLVILEPAQ